MDSNEDARDFDDDNVKTWKQERRPLLGRQRTLQNLDDDVGKKRCLKNLILHCFSILFIFTSFMSLQNLESSLNEKGAIGVTSMACLYVGLLVSCVFSPVIVRYTGYKWAMVICFGAHCIFAVMNFYPRMYTLAPATTFLGLTSGPFWTGQGQFITTLAIKYGEYADIDPNVVISRFNGMFYMFLQSSQVWGNLISSQVLQSTEHGHRNVSYLINETCGAAFCNYPNGTSDSILFPSQKEVYILVGIYLGCCVLGLLIKALFVDSIKPLSNDDQTESTLKDTVLATMRIHGNGCMLLLIPLMFFNGVEQVFLFGDFTEAFVTCELGIGYIGYALITFGAVNTLSSFAMGQLEKCSGRIFLMIGAGVINMSLLVVMLKWEPGNGTKDDWLLYFIPGLWGVSDSIWQTTTVSLIAVEFPFSRDAAFATFRFWQGAGMGTVFAYSYYICMTPKIFIAMSLLSVSMVLYMIMELVARRRMNRPYIDLYAPIVE